MRSAVFVSALCAALLAASAAPAPAPGPGPAPAPQPAPAPAPIDDNTPEIIEIIAPAASAQETLASLNLGAPGGELSERNKRTIGILRQLFPTLTQIIEQKVQQITSAVLKAFGPVILRAFLGNNGNKPRTGGGTVELADDDDDDEDKAAPGTTSTTSTTSTTPDSVSTAPDSVSAAPDSVSAAPDSVSAAPDSVSAAPDSASTDSPSTNSPSTEGSRRRRALYFPARNGALEGNQLLSGAESQQAEVRVAFGDRSDLQSAASEDQQVAAAQNNAASIDEITLEDADGSEENRNKRFLSFGGSGGATGGGSGNFLFDIVRRPAEALARAAGSAFRVFAGTDSLNLGITASHTATLDPNNPQLVTGSSASSTNIEAGAPGGSGDEGDDGAAKGDNLTEGVPGPITRLFIIANRGIANLVQDLILRLAQTSERIVNFKARLITSII